MKDPLTDKIIGCAIEVHKTIGPGLLESAYEACLLKELSDAGLGVLTQVPIKVDYKGTKIDCAFRADMIVEDKVLIELKSVNEVSPVHQAQLLTYMKLSGINKGLLMNFNVALLKDGIRRLVL
ncbi:MAG: GxxExxY protein [Rhodospirillales bacterium]|nr:GxxExxY protein [Rhodospirillales bacterium]